MAERRKADTGEAAYHAMEAEEALQRVEASPEGLSSEEAERRLRQYGRNRIKPPDKRGAFQRLLAQFHNVLIYVLIAAALITVGLGQYLDAAVIAAVVVINATIGFLQESKAENAIDAIRGMLSLKARVRRDGERQEAPAETLVPGDIVDLKSGDKVPADLRLMETRDLRIEEAALTGESVPADKATEPVEADAAVGDRASMAFSGTIVAYGTGTGVVVATGDQTEIGRISGMLAEIQPLTTPLLRHIDQFGRWLAVGILVTAATIFAIGVLARGFTATQMFGATVALAVAAIPEGLPAIITITLALGVQRMANRQAITRRLPAVETLGSVTVICSDKTGTLTRNEMTVQTVALLGEEIGVSGVGYEPEGEFTADDAAVDPAENDLLAELCRAGLLCNEASVSREEDDQWVLHGDPTEGALVTLAMKAGQDLDAVREKLPAVDTIPFESEHKYMATLHEIDGEPVIYLKGAPERVLEMCDHVRTRQGEEAELDRDAWQEQMGAIADRGQRLLALALKRPAPEAKRLDREHVESGLTLLGMVGIIDPPREDATDAVAACQEAGIRVKMITGDHARTAAAIGRQMGIGRDGNAVTGADLEGLDPERLSRTVHDSDVFARVSPEHKLRLIESLQDHGQVVAVTGDGVNDAPALKRADIGVAMGIKGTEAAKEASEMVLADDNFATIARAVKEGRGVYDNIRKALLFILPTNGGEAGLIIAAVVLGLALPVTPLQILWVNMVTAVTLALALAFEPPERDVMHRPPRDPAEPILTPFLIWRIAFVSILIVIGSFGMFAWVTRTGGSIELARTTAVNTLVVCEIFYLLNSRYMLLPVLNREGLFGSRYVLLAILAVLVLQAGFTYLPPLQALFDSRAMPLASWGWLIAIGMAILLIVELEKMLWRRRSTHGR